MRMHNLALDGAKRHRSKFSSVVLGGAMVAIAAAWMVGYLVGVVK